MRHANALSLKLMAYLLIFGVTMPVFGRLSLSKALILALVQTLLLWLVDLLILNRFGRPVTLAMDALLLTVGSLLVLGALGAVPRFFSLLLSAGFGTLFEGWFHPHLIRERAVE